tara:strand:+ start:643 stop:1533 length:891 start_codon:yes stop_codon:yes gene_type:complete
MRLALAVLLLALAFRPAAADAPRIVVSIKPLHGLVAALLEGLAKPELLLEGEATPHAFTLKPSARQALQRADVVVWIGPGMEEFLVKPLSVLPDRVRTAALMQETPDLHLLPLAETHGGDHHADDGDAHDPHIWLSLSNARRIAAYLAEVFAPLVPARQLEANALVLDQKLVALDREIAARLAPVRDRPFVVFHPAYNYFVEAYGLRQVGVLALSPTIGASARHLGDVRGAVVAGQAICAFREPQFSERAVAGLVRGTSLRQGVLDPLGASVPAGPAAYQLTLSGLTDMLVDCLTP